MVEADRTYDREAIRLCPRSQGIKPVLSRRDADHGSSLGRIRGVVETTISWFKALRRRPIRHVCVDDLQDASNRVGDSVLGYRVAIRLGICPRLGSVRG